MVNAKSHRAAMDHMDVALGLLCNAANGTENIWKDAFHEAMDLDIVGITIMVRRKHFLRCCNWNKH